MRHLIKASAILLGLTVSQLNADPIVLLGPQDFDWQTTAPCVAYLYQDGAFDFLPVLQ